MDSLALPLDGLERDRLTLLFLEDKMSLVLGLR